MRTAARSKLAYVSSELTLYLPDPAPRARNPRAFSHVGLRVRFEPTRSALSVDVSLSARPPAAAATSPRGSSGHSRQVPGGVSKETPRSRRTVSPVWCSSMVARSGPTTPVCAGPSEPCYLDDICLTPHLDELGG